MYRVFRRQWWKENPRWPRGLEPYADAPRRYLSEEFDTEEEARDKCAELNAEPQSAHDERLGYKWEYTS